MTIHTKKNTQTNIHKMEHDCGNMKWVGVGTQELGHDRVGTGSGL